MFFTKNLLCFAKSCVYYSLQTSAPEIPYKESNAQQRRFPKEHLFICKKGGKVWGKIKKVFQAVLAQGPCHADPKRNLFWLQKQWKSVWQKMWKRKLWGEKKEGSPCGFDPVTRGFRPLTAFFQKTEKNVIFCLTTVKSHFLEGNHV